MENRQKGFKVSFQEVLLKGWTTWTCLSCAQEGLSGITSTVLALWSRDCSLLLDGAELVLGILSLQGDACSLDADGWFKRGKRLLKGSRSH